MARTRELQRRDLQLSEIIDYLESDVLPSEDCAARKLLLMGDSFYIGRDGLLYHLGSNQNCNSLD